MDAFLLGHGVDLYNVVPLIPFPLLLLKASVTYHSE